MSTRQPAGLGRLAILMLAVYLLNNLFQAIAGWIMLYLRRLMDPVLRLISDADDHVSSLLVFVVLLTGCMALIQGVTALRLIHMLAFEALLVYFPFSRLMHTFMFLFSRGYTGAVYGRRGETL